MFAFLVVGIAFGSVALAFFLGHKLGRRSIPAPILPEPKHFGFNEVEKVKENLGGLTAEQAQVIQVTALVGGMAYVLPAEVKKERAALAEAMALEAQKLIALKSEIKFSEGYIEDIKARDAEITEIGSAFGI